ncbi:reverse transcriptase domain-containing protein [Tanacetum coccineum]
MSQRFHNVKKKLLIFVMSTGVSKDIAMKRLAVVVEVCTDKTLRTTDEGTARVCTGHIVPDITIRRIVHARVYSLRINNDTLGKQHNMVRRRHGKRAALQVVLILKVKCDSAPSRQDRWSPHMSVVRQTQGQRYHTLSVAGRVANDGLTSEPITPLNRVTGRSNDHSPTLQDQILDHISSLETLIKKHNDKAGTPITPIRLTFGDEGKGDKGKGPAEEADEDLKKPYKEVLKSPFIKRIIEFSAPSHRMPTNLKIYDGSTDPDDHITHFVGTANQREWEMPVWCRMFQQTLDEPARGWFDRMPHGCIDGWADLREKFVERFALRRKCSKDPTGVSKIVRKANETLPDFKERWTEEMGYIQGVSEVMQISAFMSNSKCPELARRFSDQVPQTVTEMMKRVDDFVKSDKAYKSTELPKGEHPERGQGAPYKGARPSRIMQGGGPPKMDGYNTYNRRDHYQPYASPRQPGRRYDNRRFENQRQEVNQLGLEALVKRPKEILATELQLQQPPCPPMIGTPKKENLDRYCYYHGEKGHYTNNCYQLKRQLEAALESKKLNHLVKDVRQRCNNRGRQTGNNNTNGKIMNMVYVRAEGKKCKCQLGREEDWMNVPITFPPVQSDDVSDERLKECLWIKAKQYKLFSSIAFETYLRQYKPV